MRRPRVLVIDDDASFRTEIATLLNRSGYAASAVASTDVVFSFLQVEPDIVVTELVMRDQEGLELIRKLLDLRRHVAIIAVTGGERAYSYLKTAQLMGAKATLTKPFLPEELLDAFARLAMLKADGGAETPLFRKISVLRD